MSAQQQQTFPPSSQTSPETTVDKLCDKHGAFNARVFTPPPELGLRPMVTGCPRCSEERQAEEAQRKAENEARERQDRVSRLLRTSGIPARFTDRTFDGYTATGHGQRFALNVCKRYAEGWPDQRAKGGSLVLTGGPGTGKTHLACAIGNAVMREHLAAVAFGTVLTVLRAIKDTYRRDSSRSEQDAIDALVEPDLLILDEIGIQTGSDHEKMLIFEVLNARYEQMRPTILLSNLDATDLEAFIGQRVMDRYRECGVVVPFSWESHRGTRPSANGSDEDVPADVFQNARNSAGTRERGKGGHR
jgi:DNA replication protein DnaC